MLITCPHCKKDHDINPASLLGKGKKKTMTPEAIAARQANGKKGGKPRALETQEPRDKEVGS